MKKKLLGILILPTLVMASVAGEGNSQTKIYGKNGAETHSVSALNAMYGGRSDTGEFFKKSITLEDAKQATNSSALELMYEFGTGSKNYAKGREAFKVEASQEKASTALELMYSRLS